METIVHTKGSARRRALSLALVLAAGCAGAGGAGGLSTLRRTPGKVADGQFTPGRPALASYGPDASFRCQSGGVPGIVQEELDNVAKRTGRPAPEADGRLCAMAEAFLGWEPDARPREEVLAFASQWFGLPAVTQQVLVAQIASDDPRLVAQRVLEPLGLFTANAEWARYGVSTSVVRRGASTLTKIAVAVLDAPVEVDPLPRRLDAGQAVTLTGRLHQGVTNPKVSVVDPSGQLSSPAQADPQRFTAAVKCGDRPGEIRVEIRGDVDGQSTPVANFPVACGTALPTSVAVAAEAWPADPAQASRRIFGVVNEGRGAAGLKALVWDDALARVAAGVAESLKGSGTGEDVRERLKAAGISSPVIVQSLAVDRSAERAQARLETSPSNRANLLNPDVTNAGIGVIQGVDGQNRPLVYLAELFVKELPPVDVAAVRGKLRDAVAQKRKDARATAVASDPLLEDVAQRYAEALAAGAGTMPADEGKKLTTPLNTAFKTVAMVAGAKQDPLDFAEEPAIVATGRAVGVGIAQGKNAVLGRNAVYAVVMIGTPRVEAKPAKATKKAK